jgi:ABC-2 type transport system permease protein
VIFGVEIKGSLLLLLIVALFYLLGVLGMGVLVSTITQTQVAAMLIAILVSMLPSILLSGFIFPIRQMPQALQIVTLIVPARYFIEILRDIYLKGLGLEYFWRESLYILIFGFATLFLAAKRFKKRLG